MKNSLLITFTIVFSILVTGCNSGTKKIFNGKNLEGWEVQPEDKASHWMVKEGNILHGENPDESGSMLWTTKTYRDFDLELEYKTLTDDYDTGIFPRGDGPQVQIGISRSLQRDMTACIYAPGDDRGSAYPGQTDKVAEFHKVGEWNHLRIILEGNRIRTFLNGEDFVDYDIVKINDEGPIGLQLHSGLHMAVDFRNIKIKEL